MSTRTAGSFLLLILVNLTLAELLFYFVISLCDTTCSCCPNQASVYLKTAWISCFLQTSSTFHIHKQHSHICFQFMLTSTMYIQHHFHFTTQVKLTTSAQSSQFSLSLCINIVHTSNMTESQPSFISHVTYIAYHMMKVEKKMLLTSTRFFLRLEFTSWFR